MRHFLSLAVSVAALIALCSTFGSAATASTTTDEAPNETTGNLTHLVHSLATHLKAEADPETPSSQDEERLSLDWVKGLAARFRGKAIPAVAEETATVTKSLSRSASVSKSVKVAEVKPAPEFTKREMEEGAKVMAALPLTKWGKFLMVLKVIAGAAFAWAVAASVYAMGSAYYMYH